MKITYIKLKNFIGIFNGTGRSEIEINFGRSRNVITMIVGDNGSGKSTLLSTLHPFAETLDNRKEFILPGKDGYKEIWIQDNNNLYKIQHFYNQKNDKKTIKSFIQIFEDGKNNPKELNPSGGVTLFKNIIKDIFGIDTDFFKISRLGSNVTNFIDLNPTERKKYISNFLPSLDDYMEMYKTVNGKYNLYKKEVASIANESNKYPDIEVIKNEKETLQNSLDYQNSIITEHEGKIAYNQGVINSIDPDGKIYERYLELKEILKENSDKQNNLNKEISSNVIAIKSLGNFDYDLDVDDIDNFVSFKAYLNEKVKLYEGNIIKANTIFKSKKEKLDDIKIKIEKNNSLINSFNKSEYDKAEKAIKLLDNEIKELEDYFNSINDKLIINSEIVSNEVYYKFRKTVNSLFDQIDSFKASFDSDIMDSIYETGNSSLLKKLEKELKDKTIEYNKLKVEIDNLVNEIEHSKYLISQRPKSCKDNECAFIKNAVFVINQVQSSAFKISSNRLIDLEKEISDLNNKIEKEKIIVDAMEMLKNMYNNFLSTKSFLSIFSVFKEISSINKFSDLVSSNLSIYKDKLSKYEDYIITYNQIESKRKNKEKFQNIIDSNKAMHDVIDKIEKENDELKIQYSKIKEELSVIENKRSIAEKFLERYNKAIPYTNTIIENFRTIQTLSKDYKKETTNLKKIESNNTAIIEVKEQNKKLEIELIPIKEKKKEIENKLLNCNIMMDKVKRLKERKEKLDKEFQDLMYIREALSPTKGIPLKFIDLYLTDTKKIANEFLNLSFDGKLNIDNFILLENDFLIPVIKNNGERVKDISFTSQGESSLSSVALSFALMQQSLRRYNIPLLDEMDSQLDGNNRRSFIEMLLKQFELLNIEQCFIISHNNEFDSYDVDLIVFPSSDSEINSKENIIANFN